MVADTQTPNAKLTVVAPTRSNWADAMNGNMKIIDALIGTYFVVSALKGVWANSTVYAMGDAVVDENTSVVYLAQIAHTSATVPTTFAEDRTAHSAYWSVYSSPARSRGTWLANTAYALNDFIVSGSKYAICVETHISSNDFEVDLAAGYWAVLVDLSAAGSLVLPILGGGTDANNLVTTNAAGNAYIIKSVADSLTMLGGTTVGKAVFQAVSTAAARIAIDAQISGSYQASSTYLSAISSLTVTADTMPYVDGTSTAALTVLTTFARSLLDDASAATGRTTLGLGTAAVTNTGIASGNVPVLDGSGDLPTSTIPAIDLTSMVSGVLPRANGGFTPESITNAMTADANMTTVGVYVTGPTIAQGTVGTWFVSGGVTVGNVVGGDVVDVKLWDGTTVLDSRRMHVVSVSGTYYGVVSLSGIITSPAGNLRISVLPRSRTDGAIMFNASGNSMDSTIKAIRIG